MKQQQKQKTTRQEKHRNTMGYMASLGKPRQPKTTQENKTGTLRYEHETETWHCAKCDKSYTNQNARSARAQAAEHTKTEKSNEKNRKNILQYNTQQNQDGIRLRTLRRYGRENRGKAHQINIEQGDEEDNIPSLQKPHSSSIEENRNEAAMDESKETRKETYEQTLSASQSETI